MARRLTSVLVIFSGLLAIGIAGSLRNSSSSVSNENSNGTVTPGTKESVSGANVTKEEAPDTFEDVERRLKTTVRNLVKSALPYLMEQSSGLKISHKCTGSLMSFVMGLRNLKDWAFLMVDAMAKPPSGILEGTFLGLGNYDECLGVRVTKKDLPPQKPEDVLFRGQYCMLELRGSPVLADAIDEISEGNYTNSPFDKTKTFLKLFKRFRTGTKRYSLRMAICIPSTCTEKDVQIVADAVSKRMRSSANVLQCEVKQEVTYIDNNQISILCFLAVVFVVVFIGTLVDTIIRFRTKETGMKPQQKEQGRAIQILVSFSIYSNTLKMLDTKGSDGSLEILRGLRVYSIIFIIYGAAFGNVHKLHFLKYGSAMNIYNFFHSFTFAAVANGTLFLDTIFFVCGVAVTYSRWRKPESSAVELRLSKLLLQPFFRMTALQFLVISLFLLFPLIGTGPLWATFTEPMLQNCRERWWMNILYVVNYFSSYDTCLYNTWLLSMLMQLYTITVLVLWVLRRGSYLGIGFILALLTVGGIGVGVVTAVNHLPGALAFFMLNTRTAPIMWRQVFLQIYDHIGPYGIGLLTGLFLAKHRSTFKIRPLFVTIGWSLSVACNLAVMTGLYGYRKGDEIDASSAVTYSVVHRNAWAVGLSWLVVAGSTGHGGVVSQILTWKALIPLDRMCYLAYLFTLPVIYLHTGMIRERLYMGQIDNLFLAVAYLFISFLLAGVCYVLFQAPFHFFESWIESWFTKKETLTVLEYKNKTEPTTSGIPSLTKAKPVREAFTPASEKNC